MKNIKKRNGKSYQETLTLLFHIKAYGSIKHWNEINKSIKKYKKRMYWNKILQRE